MTHCERCRQPFNHERVPVAIVVNRPGQPGHGVPRLRVTITGRVCACCARGALGAPGDLAPPAPS